MKRLIVTGANCGLGFLVTQQACSQGHKVIMTCRSEEKGQLAVEQIRSCVPEADVTFLRLDLTDFSSIRKFVSGLDTLPEFECGPDVLVNNAGVAPPFRDPERRLVNSSTTESPDTSSSHLELAMATNHLGPFLLTEMLVARLKQRAAEVGESRVVMVTSSLVDKDKTSSFDVDDIMSEQEGAYTNGMAAYIHSKAANLTYAMELAHRLEGTGVSVHSVCPGFVPGTDLSRHGSAFARFFMKYIMASFIGKWMTGGAVISPEEGAGRILAMATGSDFAGASGCYYKDGKENVPREDTLDVERQAKLGAVTKKYVGL